MQDVWSSSDTSRDTFRNPLHPYTQALISSLAEPRQQGRVSGHSRPCALAPAAAGRLRVPSALRARRWTSADRCRPEVVTRADGRAVACHLVAQRAEVVAPLTRSAQCHARVYSRGLVGPKTTVALANFSLVLDEDKPTILTVAGESGSGKTTLAMLLLGFIAPTIGPDHLSRPGHLDAHEARRSSPSGAKCRRCSRTRSRSSTRFTPSIICSPCRSGVSSSPRPNDRRAPRWTNA